MADGPCVVPRDDLPGFGIVGELLRYRVGEVRFRRAGDTEAAKHLLLFARVPVNPARVCIERSVRRRVEPEPAGIDPIAGGQIVGLRISLIDKVKEGLITANPPRIEGRDLRGRQNGNTFRPGIETGVRRTTRCVIEIGQSATAEMVERNGAQIGDPLSVTTSFIVEEEKQIVSIYRPADASAELIASQ